LAAAYLLSGAFSGKDATVTLNIELIKIREPEPVAKWKLAETEANPFNLEQELVAKTLAALRIRNPELVSPPRALNAPSPLVAVISCAISAVQQNSARWNPGLPTTCRLTSAP